MENKDNKNLEIQKNDKVTKIIVAVSSIGCFACIAFGQSLIGFGILFAGLISNMIYKVIKSKKGGNNS